MAHVVRIDKNACQSSGNCVEAQADAFSWDDDDLGQVLPGAGQLPLTRLIEIAKRCPALCISVHDEAGNEIELD